MRHRTYGGVRGRGSQEPLLLDAQGWFRRSQKCDTLAFVYHEWVSISK